LLELKTSNIRVLLIKPGAFRTQFLASGNMQIIPTSIVHKGTAVEKTADFQRYGWEAVERPGERRSKDLRSCDEDWHGEGKNRLLEMHDWEELLG
jgi:hypothetical protein